MTTKPESKDVLPSGLTQDEISAHKLEEARQKLFKRMFPNIKLKYHTINEDAEIENNPGESMSSLNEDIEEFKSSDKTNTEKIQDGYQLVDHINSVYKCDYKTRQQIIDQVSFGKIQDLLMNHEEFLIGAARKLSYKCLVFLIMGPVSPHLLRPKLTQESKGLKIFIENLRNSKKDEEKKAKNFTSSVMVE